MQAEFKLCHFCQQFRRCADDVAATRQVATVAGAGLLLLSLLGTCVFTLLRTFWK